jgi:hypothetical protein
MFNVVAYIEIRLCEDLISFRHRRSTISQKDSVVDEKIQDGAFPVRHHTSNEAFSVEKLDVSVGYAVLV